MSAAILAPHLDDAVLSCWSVVDSAADVSVLNVFAGLPPAGKCGWWDRETGAMDSAARMRERRSEDAEALAQAGRNPVNLDFLEHQYREDEQPGTEELLEAIASHVRGRVVYGPAGIGDHADHVLVRCVLGELRRRGTDVRLYADLPYCAREGWPERVAEDGRPKLPGLRARTVRLDANAQKRKLRALETYRTQFAALTAGSSLRVIDPEVLPFEVLWEPVGSEAPTLAASRS